jgi:ectoine hydroxylase-related dioxygenase (phytanoyl-CoA dioxygenase family)
VNIGQFHETDADQTKPKTGRKGDIYVTIALTELNPENGWFILLQGSHTQPPSSVVSLPRISLNLNPGDVVIWLGDLAYLHAPGGGGIFEPLVYVNVSS